MLHRRHAFRSHNDSVIAVKTELLDYNLPEELIATQPAEPRDSARILVLRRDTQAMEHHRVSDLPKLGLFKAGDLMLVNQTRVIKAYLSGSRKDTGGKVSGLYIGSDGPGLWRVMLESRGTLQPGETIVLGDAASESLEIELIQSLGDGAWSARSASEADPIGLLEKFGATPLPPYIRKQRKKLGLDELSAEDEKRYNTIFAAEAGSVAAPTAGLHFTPGLLAELEAQGINRAAVDLNVGMGTFAPVRAELLTDHDMHSETYTVPRSTLDAITQARQQGGRLWVVGTTTVRALESLPSDALEPGKYPEGVTGSTKLFIHPEADFTFRYTDTLLTNFHLPKSTLLALVASLPGVGLDGLMAAYHEAVDQRYRFYSYGDAMLVV